MTEMIMDNINQLPQPYRMMALLFLTGIAIITMGIRIISLWKLYTKAGYKGWEAVVPVYNCYILAEIAFGTGWLFFLMFVPCVAPVYICVVNYKLGRAFQMGMLFSLGLVLLPVVFLPILAFTKVGYYRKRYVG